MTEQQEYQQCEGPHRPTVRQLQIMLAKIPAHFEIRAISINGQACVTVVETLHDGMEQTHLFVTHEFYDILP